MSKCHLDTYLPRQASVRDTPDHVTGESTGATAHSAVIPGLVGVHALSTDLYRNMNSILSSGANMGSYVRIKTIDRPAHTLT